MCRGYAERPRDDTWECNFVLADTHGREIDVHSYILGDAGNNAHGVHYRRSGYPVRWYGW